MTLDAKNKEDHILEAARNVFLRYGFKRVTMHDIAEAAGISRPAIYLVFPNKEAVFRAVIQQMTEQNLGKIRSELKRLTTPREKLQCAFELWTVKPCEMVHASPDARDLIESGHAIAKDIYTRAGDAFEKILVPVLGSSSQANHLARLLRHAARGFKEAAGNVDELRQMLADLIDLALFSVEHNAKSKARVKRHL